MARTKPAALRATRLHPCVVTLGLASNTPRRRPLNTPALGRWYWCPSCAGGNGKKSWGSPLTGNTCTQIHAPADDDDGNPTQIDGC